MKVADFVKYGYNNTSFSAKNKASNIAMSVPLSINFHKLRCPVFFNYWNLFNFGVCKCVKKIEESDCLVVVLIQIHLATFKRL